MKDKEKAESLNINIKEFKYADLERCEWFVYKNKLSTIYYADNVNPPAWCDETILSYALRRMGLKKYITFGKPKNLKTIEPPPEVIDWDKVETKIPEFRIRFAEPKKKSDDENKKTN